MGHSFAPCGLYGDGVQDTTPHHGESGAPLWYAHPPSCFPLLALCSTYSMWPPSIDCVRQRVRTTLRLCRRIPMDFYAIVDQVIDVLRQRQRVTYRALKRQFNLDEDYLEDVKAELIQGQRLAVDEDGAVLVWTGGVDVSPRPPPPVPQLVPPHVESAPAPPPPADAER